MIVLETIFKLRVSFWGRVILHVIYSVGSGVDLAVTYSADYLIRANFNK
jgi:hypothetical protein